MQQKTKKWLSLVLAVLLVSACFTGTLLVRAAQDVAIDETHFPDAGFRQIVAEKCDKNGDGILSDSERSSITRMMLPAWQEDVLGEGTPIVSLEGIQYFYNLQNLYCADIGLTSLDVSALSKLTQLTCMDNALGTLDLSKNTADQLCCRPADGVEITCRCAAPAVREQCAYRLGFVRLHSADLSKVCQQPVGYTEFGCQHSAFHPDRVQ